MLQDLDSQLQADVLTCDSLIIGAGAVGLFLADLLQSSGQSAIVLETGGISHEESSSELNEVVNVGRPHDGAHHGRARVLGGTTTLWGGQLTKFSPIDLLRRDGVTDDNWPINYEQLDHYYKLTAKKFGLDVGLVQDSEVWKRANGKFSLKSAALEVFYTRWLTEPNLYRYFARTTSSKDIRIFYHAHVLGFQYSSDEKSITSVTVVSGRGLTHKVNARRVFLASGTIEISRILLHAAQAADCPWRNNPHLGKGFQDHLDVIVGKVNISHKAKFNDFFENLVINGRKYQPKLKTIEADVLKDSMPYIACSMLYRSSLSEHLGYFKTLLKSLRNGTVSVSPFEIPSRLLSTAKIWLPLIKRYLQANRIHSAADLGVFINLHCEQKPLSSSTIELDTVRTDRYGIPLAKINWQIDEDIQMLAIRNFCQRLEEFFATEDLGSIEFDPKIWLDGTAFLKLARDSYHQCGGARMSDDPVDGVVDGYGKVHGTSNLWVLGAASFPSSSFANPTFTALALTQRTFENIFGDGLTQ